MKKMPALILLATLSFSCSTLNPTTKPEPPAPDMTTITDPAQPVEVQAGETFEIVINANPSTGYHWEIIGDLNGVDFVSRDYKADEPILPGSGGFDVWTFRAISAGQTQITLGSYPPGMGVADGEPEQAVSFNIIVK